MGTVSMKTQLLRKELGHSKKTHKERSIKGNVGIDDRLFIVDIGFNFYDSHCKSML